jgi:hypothetical protein
MIQKLIMYRLARWLRQAYSPIVDISKCIHDFISIDASNNFLLNVAQLEKAISH